MNIIQLFNKTSAPHFYFLNINYLDHRISALLHNHIKIYNTNIVIFDISFNTMCEIILSNMKKNILI